MYSRGEVEGEEGEGEEGEGEEGEGEEGEGEGGKRLSSTTPSFAKILNESKLAGQPSSFRSSLLVRVIVSSFYKGVGEGEGEREG
jgi:hypothetical protein